MPGGHVLTCLPNGPNPSFIGLLSDERCRRFSARLPTATAISIAKQRHVPRGLVRLHMAMAGLLLPLGTSIAHSTTRAGMPMVGANEYKRSCKGHSSIRQVTELVVWKDRDINPAWLSDTPWKVALGLLSPIQTRQLRKNASQRGKTLETIRLLARLWEHGNTLAGIGHHSSQRNIGCFGPADPLLLTCLGSVEVPPGG